jgi:hypothetical protein
MNSNNDERRIPHFQWFSLILLIFLTGSVASQTPWKDPSPHHVSFVAVEKGVKLEVLDWGGHSRPVDRQYLGGRARREDARRRLSQCILSV